MPTVVTATQGPVLLQSRERFPARLTSRLAGGLVVALESWQAASRLYFLEEAAQRQQLAVAPDILPWLAQHLTGGGRQLEGAIHQLRELVKQQRQDLDLEAVEKHFQVQADADRPTMERIARQVSGYFHLEPGQLQSQRRYRNIMLPRQVSMYLARQLTTLSLDQIGAYFGGRDHTTVLHACRKVERALKSDATFSGAVRQLQAELG